MHSILTILSLDENINFIPESLDDDRFNGCLEDEEDININDEEENVTLGDMSMSYFAGITNNYIFLYTIVTKII